MNAYLVTIALYFEKKFGHVEKQVASMRCESERSIISKSRFNLRLAEMIRAYNVVLLELRTMNTFFRSYVGFCICHYFFLVILVGFSSSRMIFAISRFRNL